MAPPRAAEGRRAIAQRPGRVRLARALACVALLLPAVALALHMANASSGMQTWWVNLTVISAGLSAMGALLASRMPDNPIGWIFLAGGIGQGLTAVGQEWAVFGYVTHPGSLPAPPGVSGSASAPPSPSRAFRWCCCGFRMGGLPSGSGCGSSAC